MRDDGTFDPLLKLIAGAVLAVAAAKVFWQWLTTSFWHWLSMDVWGLDHRSPLVVGAHRRPRRPGSAPGGGSMDLRSARARAPLGRRCRGRGPDRPDVLDPPSRRDGPDRLREGLRRTARPGRLPPGAALRRSGDLGADVTARDHLGRKVVLQCKHDRKPVGSRDVQTFNGTARPEHGADVPVMIGLNGFTRDAAAFAARHDLILIDRRTLTNWAHGTYLYDAIDEDEHRAAA
ncbi:restriction endonuclease [Streptomyces sp. SP17BM10]|uniref:restriction endonuclease n=1 Tax=Streptomyces sp. SP17BM10 TaxID=3002530 RepID=UPI002E782AF6|nr:restriction endonuclease [Streptomyces sp. SP17BM10]MEE1783383.1 restriction endonuclease [Streptomyces sp. SP17BM10]